MLLRPIWHSKDKRCITHIYICILTLLIKYIIKKEIKKEKFEEILNRFSYEIETDKGVLTWGEKK